MKTKQMLGPFALGIILSATSFETYSARLPSRPTIACDQNSVNTYQVTTRVFSDGTGLRAAYKCVRDDQGIFYWDLIGFVPCIVVGNNGCVEI
jgi:hypothetical protein